MTPERWQRIHAIFDEALRQDPAAREQYLEQTCAHDSEARALVNELLAHDAQAGQDNFLPTPNHPRFASLRSAGGVDRTQPAAPTASDTHDPKPKPAKIVPKGLRSFDANDADFFLELLPGPRDRN